MAVKDHPLHQALPLMVFLLYATAAAGQASCSMQSASWASAYGLQSSYVPGAVLNPTPSALKTVHFSIHVWPDPNNFGSLFNDPWNIPYLQQVLPAAEHIYANNDLPSDPVMPMAYYQGFTDTKIRFQLDAIYFNSNTTIFPLPGSAGALMNAAAIAEHPECARTVNIHIVNQWAAGGNGQAQLPLLNDFETMPWIVRAGGHQWMNDQIVAVWAGSIAHEIAHCLGLNHLYLNQFSSYDACSAANADFLDDAITTLPNPNCNLPTQPGCDVCWYNTCSVSNDPSQQPVGDPSYYCCNNIMGGTNMGNTYNFTPLQLGRMHRSLMVANVAPYAWGFDPAPYALAQNETWDFPVKFYQDIIIPAGVTLTVKCELHMVPQAGIIVQPGGRLVVDGGRIQAARFATERWRGIQLNGSPNLPQSYANQGVVELLNGAVIADAIVGINVGGLSLTTGSGGIVRSIGSTQVPIRFVNCARAVRFYPYLQPSPLIPGTYLANLSSFTATRFEVDPAFMTYPGATPFLEHVRLNRVVGIRFRSCTFINTRTAATSAELGHGIRAQDAHFFALGSRFEGLDHGIHATGIQPYGWFQAQANVFKNNICGVYASQPTGCRIVGNRFVMGLRDVQLTNPVEQFWFGYHRGIFMHETAKFTIQGNVLERDDDPLADELTEGIVIGYNRDYNDVVRSNRTINLNRGFVGEGVSCSTVAGYASVIGLQFKCNECQNTPVNIWSRPDGSVPLIAQQQHSIRAHQGDLNSLADNQLDNWPAGGISTDDFRVTTSFTPIKYLNRAAAPYAPTDWSLPNMAFPWLIDPPPTNTCPIISEPPYALVPPAPQESVQHLYAGKLAYGNVRYQYDQLIDGGSTDEVVEEITTTWPQDYLELRTYLLSKSPYLSVDALKQAMEKEGFPDAIRAEVCIANPEATQSDGFIKWLMTDCTQPLPEYLIGSVVASWDNRTYRSTLELQMAQHHERYSQGALALSDKLLADTVAFPLDSLIRIWQEVRTPAARYAEALALMEQGAYSAASQLISSLPVEHKLKSPELLEQQRMLAWIAFVQQLRLSGRTEAELTLAEIAQLEQLIGDAQDRPAVWVGQLLCFHYDLCRTIHTGAGEDPKRLPYTAESTRGISSTVQFSAVPNPASAWISLSFKADEEARAIVMSDLAGRTTDRVMVDGNEGQVIWDCRRVPAGTYLVSLYASSGALLAVQRAIIKP